MCQSERSVAFRVARAPVAGIECSRYLSSNSKSQPSETIKALVEGHELRLKANRESSQICVGPCSMRRGGRLSATSKWRFQRRGFAAENHTRVIGQHVVGLPCLRLCLHV